MIREK
jgi:hypothetical protein